MAELTPITSSNVVAAGWNDGVLTIQFKSGTYCYETPKGVFDALLAAPSAGKFVHEHIRGLPCTRLEDA